MTKIIHTLRSGQITIPAEFRRRLGIKEEMPLKIILEKGELRIIPFGIAETIAGSPWLRDLYDFFAPVRKEAKKYSSKKINETIKKAVSVVRKKHA
ncbi:MAG: AbrB/MazE/SpoVT family DNA-binding domain-containing protein [Patescibacteria group bacterium]